MASKYLYWTYMLQTFALLAPTLILGSWFYICFSNGWSFNNAAVSRIISPYRGNQFYFMLACLIPSIIMLLFIALVRNIQLHVHSVNDNFSLCWRYLNILGTISTIIGIMIGLPLMIAFNSTDDPFIHIIWAGVLIIFLFFGELFQTMLTFKHRDFVRKRDNQTCKGALFYVDAIYFLLTSVMGVTGAIVYVALYQSTGTDITAKSEGIQQDYYQWQWIGVIFQLCYLYMYSVTLYFDRSDDEMQLFLNDSYFYIINGLCNVNYAKQLKDNQNHSANINHQTGKPSTDSVEFEL